MLPIVGLTWVPPRPPISMLRITVLIVLCLRPFAGKYFASWETGHSQLWNWGCGGLTLTLSNLTVFDSVLLSVWLHFYLRNTFRQLSAKLILSCSVPLRLQTTFPRNNVEKRRRRQRRQVDILFQAVTASPLPLNNVGGSFCCMRCRTARRKNNKKKKT